MKVIREAVLENKLGDIKEDFKNLVDIEQQQQILEYKQALKEFKKQVDVLMEDVHKVEPYEPYITKTHFNRNIVKIVKFYLDMEKLNKAINCIDYLDEDELKDLIDQLRSNKDFKAKMDGYYFNPKQYEINFKNNIKGKTAEEIVEYAENSRISDLRRYYLTDDGIYSTSKIVDGYYTYPNLNNIYLDDFPTVTKMTKSEVKEILEDILNSKEYTKKYIDNLEYINKISDTLEERGI